MIHTSVTKIEHSPRLQRLLAYLQERGEKGATTRQIIHHANVVAVNSAATELRGNGFLVRCEYVKKTKSGAKIYRYTIGQKDPY